jgi:hypothetical protein
MADEGVTEVMGTERLNSGTVEPSRLSGLPDAPLADVPSQTGCPGEGGEDVALGSIEAPGELLPLVLPKDRDQARRQTRVQERLEAVERSKLTLTQLLRIEAADRAEEIVAALVQRAVDEPNSQASAILWDRIEGRVVEKSEVKNLSDPWAMSEEDLVHWLRQAPNEEPQPSELVEA